MATWAIGDVQGCDAELDELLKAIGFDATADRLWFAGDLVNRGPDSLAVLRRVHALRDVAVVVLGNHDLHLLACRWGNRRPTRKDTFDAVLAAPDADLLLGWLRGCPLLHVDETLRAALVHAGIAPAWNVTTARQLAGEVEAVLRGDGAADFLENMYGNEPARFEPGLAGVDRLRAITNSLTRMRVCYPDGRLDLKFKRGTDALAANDVRQPWFDLPGNWPKETHIYFGHWAALGAANVCPNVHALDSGCVWGGALTAACVEDGRVVYVPSRQPRSVEQ